MCKIERLLDAETKGKDYIVLTGDFNVVVGKGKEDIYVGHYGLGYRNDCGEMLVDIIATNDRQVNVTNTWFTQGRKCRISWMKPGDT